MPCPKATHGRHKDTINHLLERPATNAARGSHVLRLHLDRHGWVTPNIAWSEMADTRGAPVPKQLHVNAIRHCWNLERFSRALGAHRRHGHGKRVAIRIDGPYRTPAHNRAVGGAVDSQHVHADASDHFKAQVEQWMLETGLSEDEVINLAKHHFTAIGNENSGTLHFDSRPGRKGSVEFVTWQGAR